MKTIRTSARVTEQFRGARDGQVYPEELKVGDVIDGDLARAAVADGKAEEIKPEPAAPPAETGWQRGRGANRRGK